MLFKAIAFSSFFVLIGVTRVLSKEVNITLSPNSQVDLPSGHTSGFIFGPTGSLSYFSAKILTTGRMTIYLESAVLNCSSYVFFVKPEPGPKVNSSCATGSLTTGLVGTSSEFLVFISLTSGPPSGGKDPAFVLKYYACGEDVPVKGNGSIVAPSTAVVSAMSNCSWYLTSSPNSVILAVTTLDIEKSAGCTKDKLILRVDGREVRLCDPTVQSDKLKLLGSRFEIEFAVDTSNMRDRNFVLEYSPCSYDEHIASGQSLSIQSFGYPAPLPANVHCEWHLKTDTHHTLYALLDELVLQSAAQCSAGFLEFSNPSNKDTQAKKYCTTLTGQKAFMQSWRNSDFILFPPKIQDLVITVRSPANEVAKFKVNATSLKVLQEFRNSNSTSSSLSSLSFPGPAPDPLFLRYFIINQGRHFAVYLENFTLPPAAPCSQSGLLVTDGPWGTKSKKVCPADKAGFLGNFVSRATVDFFAAGAATADFKLRLEYALGSWNKWERFGECSVDCGSGLHKFRRSCNAPSGGCFLPDGRTRAEMETRFVRCPGRRKLSTCKKTKKETWYSVEFTLKFSSSVSSKLFNETIGPAIQDSIASGVTKFCNKNPSSCCKQTDKQANSEARYGFLSASGVLFTSDSPFIWPVHSYPSIQVFVEPAPNEVRLAVFAVPDKTGALCGNKGALRRKKRAAADRTGGAMKKEVLLLALKDMGQTQLANAISAALQNSNSTNITASFLKSYSAVKAVDAPITASPEHRPNFFLLIGLSIILIAIGGVPADH